MARSSAGSRSGAASDGAEVVPAGDGEAEVGDARPPVPVDHDVRRLQGPVDDAPVVSSREAREELLRQLEDLGRREAADPVEQRGEVLAVDVLHADVGQPFCLADVEDAADVRVGDRPRDPDLVVKSGERLRVPRDALGEDLQGDGLAELQVVSPIDDSHFDHGWLPGCRGQGKSTHGTKAGTAQHAHPAGMTAAL